MVVENCPRCLAFGHLGQQDSAGNVFQDSQNRYLYDAEGRICAVQSFLNNSPMVGYLYNAEGVRIAKGTLSYFSCDTNPSDPAYNHFAMTTSYILGPGNEQLTELNWSGGVAAPAHTNVFAAGQLVATYSFNNDANASSPATVYFHITDWLGTRRALTDNTGEIQQTCDSLPFGSGEDCPTLPTEHLYIGKERDIESGLDYFGARYYLSNIGRFMSADWSAQAEPVPYAKLDDPQTLNLFAYVRNNPVGLVDPDGHNPYPEAPGYYYPNIINPIACIWNQMIEIKNKTERQEAHLQRGLAFNAAQQQSANNTDVMLMAKAGPSVGANPKPYQRGTDGTAYMDWQIVPQANNISQLPSDPHAALGGKYSNAMILLDESKSPSEKGHWEGTRIGSGHDSLNPLALPVTQKWYINTGGVNNSGNQRIQLVVGMQPDGTLIKAWTVTVTAGPVYKKED